MDGVEHTSISGVVVALSFVLDKLLVKKTSKFLIHLRQRGLVRHSTCPVAAAVYIRAAD